MVSSVSSSIVSNGENPLKTWAEAQDKKRMDALQKKSQDGTISKLEKTELCTRKVAEAFKNLSSPQISFGENKSKVSNGITEYNSNLTKEVIEKEVVKRIEQGLHPQMAKEIFENPGWAQTFVFTDKDGNYIFPNKVLNNLYRRGFHYTKDEHGFPGYRLANGDCVYLGYNESSSKYLSSRTGKEVKCYDLKIENDDPYAVPKERFEVCTNWKDGKSVYHYSQDAFTPFGIKVVAQEGKLEDIQ